MKGSILVTGTGGFVGKAILNKIYSVHSVYYPSHSQLDLTDYQKVGKYYTEHPDISCTVHCAVAPPRRYKDIKTERDYSEKILADICMAANVLRFSPKTVLFTTGMKSRSGDVGWSSLVMGAIAKVIPNTIELIPYGIYGPGEHPSRFPSYCFHQILRQFPIYIEAERPMSWIYIEDVCDITRFFISNEWSHNSVELVTPDSISMKEIANTCLEIANIDVPIITTGTGAPYVGDPTRLYEEIPKFTPTTLKKGLKELYETIIFSQYK